MDEPEEAGKDKTVSFNQELSTVMFACSQPAQESNQSPFHQGAEKGLWASRSEELWCLIAGVAKKKKNQFSLKAWPWCVACLPVNIPKPLDYDYHNLDTMKGKESKKKKKMERKQEFEVK